jgi:hypothetical protein
MSKGETAKKVISVGVSVSSKPGSDKVLVPVVTGKGLLCDSDVDVRTDAHMVWETLGRCNSA